MYDAIIVGARCAGASTAMLLARRGHKVLLVDRTTFPSDIPHGHFLHRGGPARLKRWGLLDRVAATGAPAITAMTTDYGDFPLSDRDILVEGAPLGYGPRRHAIDQILVEAAVEAGAELRTGFSVQDYIGDGTRITGIRGREGPTGALVTEQALVTIGADGRNSRLARTVAPRVRRDLTAHLLVFLLLERDTERRDRAVCPGKPGHHRLPLGRWAARRLRRLARGSPSPGASGHRAHFMEAVHAVPALAGRIRAGQQEERFFGASDLPNFLRRPYGPGWALVGDAGCHKDPFLALGMCDAFRDAELLAEALDDGLIAGSRRMNEALADYHRERDIATLPAYRLNLHLARTMTLPAEMMSLRAAVRGDAEATRRYFLVNQGVEGVRVEV